MYIQLECWTFASKTWTKLERRRNTVAMLLSIDFTGCVYGTEDFRQVTIIARTNLGLFEEMAKVIKSPGGEKKRLGFVGVSSDISPILLG